MARHPRERYPATSRTTRKDFLLRSGAAALALGGGASFLAACGNTSAPSAGPSGGGTGGASGSTGSATTEALVGPGGIPLARKGNPVTLPLYDDNPAIQSGLKPESGPLKIYNWNDYLYKKVMKDFGKKHGVDVQLTTFYTMDEAIGKLASGNVDFDVFFPTPDVLAKIVAGKLIQPLNFDYIPNLQKNVWPSLQNPFYDQGPHYSVPYTIYTTGVGWRTDHFDFQPDSMDNPWGVFWEAQKASGKVHLLDDRREAIVLGLLKNGITDVNTEDPDQITKSKQDLEQLIDLVNVKVDTDDWQDLPDGRAWLHQSWSGDMVSAQYYLPKGTKPDVLGYWFPEDGKGPIANDMLTVLAGSKSPVLAHMFLDYMLEVNTALTNFGWVGYQPPIEKLDADYLVKQGYIPKNLMGAVVRKEDFDEGFEELALTPEGDTLWQDAWSEFKAGV